MNKIAAKSYRKQTRFVGLFQTGFGLVSGRLALVTFFLSIYYLLFTIYFTPPVHAQSECDQDPNLTILNAITKINKCIIEENNYDDKAFNKNVFFGTIDSLYLLLMGKSQLNPEVDNITAGTGALAASGRMVAMLYAAPPVSGIDYFAYQIQKFNPVQPVYAQTGIGYDVLKPVRELWTAFRNIAYVGFVIIFVIIGFMIMFRAKISPQAVASVQDSIPRIVIALILVTFSYAIAGLMIDAMFVFLNIAIKAIPQSLLPSGGDYVFQKSIFSVILESWKDVFVAVADAISKIIDGVVKLPLKLDKIIAFLGGGVTGIIVGIAILFIMFRVFLMLLMAYAMIILLTMAAPFFFLIQALPGNNGAKEWFKQMAANISVFPVTALMFIFAGILGGIESLGGGSGAVQPGQVAPFPLLVGNIDPNVVGKLIGIGFLLMTPSAAQMIKEMIGAKGPNLGGAIGAGLAAGAAPVGAFGRGAWERAYTKGPLGAGGRAAEARRQEEAQKRAGTGIYSKRYEDIFKPREGGKG